MLFNYIYNLPNNTTGIDQIAVDTVGIVPSFTPLLLVFIFMLVFLGGIGRQKARLGTADYPMWAVIASLACLMTTLILSTVSGILQLDWLIIVIVITIFSGVWLFFDKQDNSL